jgi:drug/metabolite transporter (DMT)-like permease
MRSSSGETALHLLGLAATGTFIGVAVPMARVAGNRGIDALSWSFATSAIAGALLLAASVGARTRPRLGRGQLVYYVTIGLFSMALPSALLFSAVRVVGANVGSLAYTLPPLFTVALAALTGLDAPTPRRAVGVAVGFAGALAVILPRGVLPQGASLASASVVLFVPLSLATGNLLRTRLWPAGSSALSNAAGATTAGVLWLGTVLAARGEGTLAAIAASGSSLLLAFTQAVASSMAMVTFFWLQRAAGLVFTSQVGYVATAAGLSSAWLFLGEPVSPWLGLAVALIALGAAIARRQGTKPGAA